MKSEIALLTKLKAPEITTSMLLGAFSNYQDARGKINSLSKNGLLTPVKQGVYVLASELASRPYSKEILANLIYGPSYISLETALSHYGFIPERVMATTSICFGRARSFETPLGEFQYHHIKESLYPLGVQLKEVFDGAFCQYASPEKALLDFIYIKERKSEFKNQKDYFNYLLESYRFDLDTIQNKISVKKMHDLSERFPFQHVHWFSNELSRTLVK